MSEGGDGPFCRVCNREFRDRRRIRWVCCNGDMCGCYGRRMPDEVCSIECLDREAIESEAYEATNSGLGDGNG